MKVRRTTKPMTAPAPNVIRLLLAAVIFCCAAHAFGADASDTPAGTTIVNRAAAAYRDEEGAEYETVSPTVEVVIAAVPSVTVTPDEDAPSGVVAPNDRVTRFFRICNTGNAEDSFVPTRAEVSAPAVIAGIYFDADDSGTITDADTPVTLDQTATPRLARTACAGVLFDIATGSLAVRSQLEIKLTARSSRLLPSTDRYAQDYGTIINSVGAGVVFTAPVDASLPPLKYVENQPRFVAQPGQTLNYKIVFRNSGSVAARQARVMDELPAQLEYLPGTLRLNARPLTDAADTDEGSTSARRLELVIPAIAPDAVTQIEFQARLSSAAVGGGAVINRANLSAANAPAVVSTEAVVITDPVGVVYAGNSGGAVRVAGAQITVSTEENGAPLALDADFGFAPNAGNANPFTTDAQGGFSFALTNAQIAAGHYFVNVAAQNYRSRSLEVRLAPGDSDGLFRAEVRALDNLPIAVAGGFMLTRTATSINNLAALVFNIPMFDVSTLEISKSADKQFAQIGDIVSYRVQLRNASSLPLSEVFVRDTLPASFAYAAGTAQIQSGRNFQQIEPEVAANVLTFQLNALPAGASATLSYRVRIGASAAEGEHFNTAAAGGLMPDGTPVVTAPARAGVRVAGGVFSMRQIVIGRVYEDRNGNGKFDKGERPVAGARIYTDNGQSVVTDSAGQYNLPAVGEGSLVVSLDPLTLPANYYLLAEDDRKNSQSWTRLLRSPLGGGSLMRQNFAVAPESETAAIADDVKVLSGENSFRLPAQDAKSRKNAAKPEQISESRLDKPTAAALGVPARYETNDAPNAAGENSDGADESKLEAGKSSATYTVAATENVAPVAPGGITLVSPEIGSVIMAPALSVRVRVAKDWTVKAVVNGEVIGRSNIGETRVDNRNLVTTISFVGINLKPGGNAVKLTAVSADGTPGDSADFSVYGRGAAEKMHIKPAKNSVSAGGRDAVPIEIKVFDRWGNPAIDGQVMIETSAGRLYARQSNEPAVEGGELPRQQAVSTENGVAVVYLVAESGADAAHLKAVAGSTEAAADVRFTAELRPTLMVGTGEFSAGSNAPEIVNSGDDVKARGRLAFYYRGQILGGNLLTVAYDSQQPLNRVAGRDRFGGFDPLDRAYPLFGDSSQRFEDAQSNSKLYARFDHGNSYAMFGDMETDLDKSVLAGYSRRLTGVKLHLENSGGDFVSVTGARPDTAFARDVFPGGGLSVVRLSHGELLSGSEVVTLETRDRRRPEIILSRETLIRSIDYNLDSLTGEMFLLRPVATFDARLNLVQIVVAYEHRGAAAANYVYTGRASKNLRSLGLRVGASFVNQRQGDIGAFQIGGADFEKSLWNGGKISVEAAVSRGRFAAGVGVFDDYHDGDSRAAADASRERNGTAISIKLEQPVSFMHSRIRAEFTRADAGFFNPFGATVAAGTQRFGAAIELKPNARRNFTFEYLNERRRAENAASSRSTYSFLWAEQWRDNLRTTLGFDHRETNAAGDQSVSSNLVTANIEYRPIEKLELSVKREQNLTEADQTYPNQTTFSAKYLLAANTKLFVTQRLASAPITPLGDLSGSGFAAVGSNNETAFGIETKLPRFGAVNGRYQVENGANGLDGFAVIGLQNRWNVTERLALEGGFERGMLIKGTGKSFNSATFGAAWTPLEGFRASARYELRDRGGLGQIFTVGAAGKIGDDWTTLLRAQISRSSFGERGAAAANVTAAAAYRPLNSDKYALLFSYNRRSTTQTAAAGGQSPTADRADTLSTDGLYQLSKDTEIYGRFALRYAADGNTTTAYASSLTYLAQARLQRRLSDAFDLAAETRWLAQPQSNTFRHSFAAEAGYWLLADLRLGLGYNYARTNHSSNASPEDTRNFKGGLYFTVTTKLSNIFDLFGTSSKGLAKQRRSAPGGGDVAQNNSKPR